MVTWWKRIKYSSITKAVACILLSIAVLLVFQGSLILEETRYQSPYYENWNIQNELITKAGYVRDWIVRYTGENIFDKTQITEEEVDKYIQDSEALRTSKEKAILDGTEQEVTAIEERAKEGILADRKQYKAKIEEALASPNVLYFAVNKNTNEVITNLESYSGKNQEEIINMLTSKPLYIKGNGATLALYEGNNMWNEGQFQNYYNGKAFVEQYDYEIYVTLADTFVPGDIFYTQKTKDMQLVAAKEIAIPQVIIGALFILLISLYGLKVIGKTPQSTEKIVMKQVDKVSFEIQGVLALVAVILWISLFGRISYIMITCRSVYFDLETYGMSFLIIYIMLTLGLGIALVPITSFIRHVKNKSAKQNWLCIRLMQNMANAIKEDNMVGWVIGGGAVYVFIIGFLVFLMVVGTSPILSLILWIVIMIMLAGAFLGIIKLTIDYVEIAKTSQEIAGGDLEAKVELTHTLPIMARMASNLNNIGQGLEESVEKSLKSERLKTELITNVSHDLKTPLTSIISYIDLLKDEEIENKVAQEYIEVLAERSNRLKQLVEDLVEASKAATGNLKSDLQVLKLNELVLQAMGEYSDRLAEGHLEVVVKPLEEVSILADGRHMWRIIENLLSNVSKYAMSYTRVYIEVRQDGEYGKLIIKNISKESLNLLDASELTERFVRGDDSRTTEGSGLGLAIAQSLTQLQHGKLSIHLDGDLFKVEVSIPCSR